jgi:hypothetical protein
LVVVSRDPLAPLDAFRRRTLYPHGQTTELLGPLVGGLCEFSDLLPSLTSGKVLEAQFEYLDRRARLDGALDPVSADSPSEKGSV